MADILTEVAPLHTVTASETIGAGFGSIPRGDKGDSLSVRVQFWDTSQASGSGVWTFTAQASYDNGNTWTTVSTGTAITLTAVAQSGEQLLSFAPSRVSDSSQDLVQVLATLTGAPVTPTLTYRADLVGATF